MNAAEPRNAYDSQFYEFLSETARRSARRLIPVLLERLTPTSVVDVGCGTGAWLSCFKEFGVDDVSGLDGGYFAHDKLEFPVERYREVDLSRPFETTRTYDLAISLEVAEHLPEASADGFVESLTRLAPVVLFSAAIPGQGGAHHVNEQWPEYWAERFARHGFVPVDCLRPRVWRDAEVAWWYAQNTLLFCRSDWLAGNLSLSQEAERRRGEPLSLVHPRKYLATLWEVELVRQAAAVARAVPPGAPFILVDDGALGSRCGELAIPFPERDGVYFGRPADDEDALGEYQRLKDAADYLVVTPTGRWWLDYYAGWSCRLRREHPVVFEGDELVVFDLRKDLPSAAGVAP